MLPGRVRRVINMKQDVLVDLLSWKYAEASSEPNARNHFKTMMKNIHSKLGALHMNSAYRLDAISEAQFNPDTPMAPMGTQYENLVGADDSIIRNEFKFGEGLVEHLVDARYSLISAEEFSYSNSNSYSFTIPTRVAWKEFDKSFASRMSRSLYANDKEFSHLHMPLEADRVLIFHRGIGMNQSTSLRYSEKVDEVVRRSALWIQLHLLRLVEKQRKRAMVYRTYQTNRAAPFIQAISSQVDHIKENYLKLVSDWIQSKIALNQIKSEAEEKIEVVKEHIVQEDRSLEEAMSLRVTLKGTKMSLWNLIFPVTLQEPTYKDVYLMYRRTTPKPCNDLNHKSAMSFLTSGKVSVQQVNPLNIYVKHFRNVPLADIELLFPETRVHISVADEARFLVMTGIGMLALYPALTQPLPDLYHSPTWIAAVVASSSYYLRTLSRLYSSWVYYSTLPKSFLVDKINATGAAAVTWVALQAQDQVMKEVTIIYMAMLPMKQPTSYQDIQTRSRHVLQQVCSSAVVDFEPAVGLKWLARLDIVQPYRDGTPVDNVSNWSDISKFSFFMKTN